MWPNVYPEYENPYAGRSKAFGSAFAYGQEAPQATPSFLDNLKAWARNPSGLPPLPPLPTFTQGIPKDPSQTTKRVASLPGAFHTASPTGEYTIPFLGKAGVPVGQAGIELEAKRFWFGGGS